MYEQHEQDGEPGHRARQAARRKWADAEYRRKQSAAKTEFWSSPERRAAMAAHYRRRRARAACQAARLPLLHKFVDRAAALFAQGKRAADVQSLLSREFAAEIDLFAQRRAELAEGSSA